jgi:hypothetical protein
MRTQFLEWVKSIRLVTTVIAQIAISPIKIYRMTRFLLVAITVVLFVGVLMAQAPAADAQPSLADVARQTRQRNSGKAKTVITEETIAAAKGPIPEINADGVDNSKQIIAAIEQYKATHTPKETEEAVRDWYEGEKSQLEYEYQQSSPGSQSYWTYYYGSQDHSPTTQTQARERQLTEARASAVNQRSMMQSGERRSHIQNRLSLVRAGVLSLGLRYDWFKIPCGYADCSY